MFRPTLALAVSLLAFAACSSNDNHNDKPDASGSNAGSDAPTNNCTTLAYDTPSFLYDDSDDTFAAWSAPVTTDLGGTSTLQFEFYDTDMGTDLTQPIDLTSGNFANYKTCEACIHMVTRNADGDIVKHFFQDGGMLKLDLNPIATQHMMLTATDVSLVEVTLDDDYASTPVDGGTCVTLGSFTLDRDKVAAAWTCDHAAFADGATCDCVCGAPDPDCQDDAAPVTGCTSNQICGGEATCIDKCNIFSTPPIGCTAGNTCGVSSDVQDLCFAATDPRFSPAALGADCASATAVQCAVVNTVATGFCDFFAVDDNHCRKACDATADCAGNEICQTVVGAKGLCVAKPANDTCQNAVTLTLGTAVTGTTGGATGNYAEGLDAATCTAFSQAGPDVAYKVALTAGQAITVTLSALSPEYDGSISIAGPGTAAAVCDAASINCLKGADAGLTGDNETFNFTATTAGTYYIIVDGFSDSTGSFTLTAAAM